VASKDLLSAYFSRSYDSCHETKNHSNVRYLHASLGIDFPQLPFAHFTRDVHSARPKILTSKRQNYGFFGT